MKASEQWASVDDFPGYQVSDLGRVFSELTSTMLRPSMNSTGSLKVNLMRDNHIHTRSVRVLVALAFLEDVPNLDNATPINVDGDHWNNRVDNLMWRPRWFAWKYMRQFTEPVPSEYLVPVADIVDNKQFPSTVDAGIYSGVLWDSIYSSILTGRAVYPTGSIYVLL